MSSGADLYVAMISKNLTKIKGTPAFTCKAHQDGLNLQRRSQQRALLVRKPDQGNYDPMNLNYKRPIIIRLDKMGKGSDLRIRRDADQVAFNRLECADYSSFKEKDMATVQFGNLVERDEVSFYSQIATYNKAKQAGLTVEEYTKKKQEHKSGRKEHTIFMKS